MMPTFTFADQHLLGNTEIIQIENHKTANEKKYHFNDEMTRDC